MKKVFAIIMSAMMLVCFMPAMAFADEVPAKNWENNGKFKLEISSGEASAFAEVYDDYSVLGKVFGETVNSKSVSATVTMKNVASLGVGKDESRQHTIGFGIEKEIKPSLPAFFPHIFGCVAPQPQLYQGLKDVPPFSGATLTGKVNGYDFTYKVSAVTKTTEQINEKETSVYTMTAKPNSKEAVQKAWHELTSKVEATQSSDETNDSKIEIPKGAYLQIGDQKLLFEKNCTVNPSDKTSGGANKVIRDAARLFGPEDGIKALENNVQMYIPKGSVLRVGDSIATLKAGIYIKSNSKAVKGEDLTELRNPTNLANEPLVNMILAAIKITDSAVADIDVNDLDITILTECYVTVDGKENTYVYGDTFTLPAADSGKKWVDADNNTVKAGPITVTSDMELKQVEDKTGGSIGGGGGGFVPIVPTETPLDKAKAEANTAVKAAGSANKYDEAEQAEVKKILDKAEADIKAAKTEDEVKKIQEAAQAEIEKILTSEENAQIKALSGVDKDIFKAKSKYSKLRGKRAVKVTWNVPKGMKLDGYEVFRSTKRYSGFGTKPYFTTSKTSYVNNKGLVRGKTYYYKVRGFVEINGERYYTGFSTKAFRIIK